MRLTRELNNSKKYEGIKFKCETNSIGTSCNISIKGID